MATSQLRSLLTFAIGAVVVFVLAVVAMFWFTREGPQDHLTERVEADVLDTWTSSSGSGGTRSTTYRVGYEYRFEGHTYYAKATYRLSDGWSQDDLWLCIDPDEPTANAPLFRGDAGCGDEDLDNATWEGVRIR